MRDGTTTSMTNLEKLSHLEGLRDRIKAYNLSCKKGHPNPSLLDDFQDELELQRRINWLDENGAFRPYVLQNLGATIRRLRLKVQAQWGADE